MLRRVFFVFPLGFLLCIPKPVEWNDIKKSMLRENLLPDIINFNTSALSQSIVKRITKNFLNHKD
jgi:hypothetical protein